MDNGGPAFPIPLNQGEIYKQHGLADGMTLRDYFAGQALASIPIRNWEQVGDDEAMITAWAKCCYLAADAMLKAREVEGDE